MPWDYRESQVEDAMPCLAENERHIVQSVTDFLDGAGGLARARKLQAGTLSFDQQAWEKMASLGWFGAAVPESQGGLGLQPREIIAMLEAAGTRLLPEPWVPVIAASAALARIGGSEADVLTANLIEGKTLCFPVPSGESGAEPASDGAGRFSGITAYVSDAHAAQVFLVGCASGERFGVFAVAANTPGLAIERMETVDGGSVLRLAFDKVRRTDLTLLSEGPEALPAMHDARDWMRLGYAALLVGLMDEALRMSVAYLKERRQFGVPIGSFQALQHRAASLYVRVNAARAMLYEACQVMGTARQALGAAAAKANASEVALHVVKESVQFHGAMGYSDEHNISLYFRRAVVLAAAGGNAMECRREFHCEAQAHAFA
jgi:alkylation response protein AidB-like acyl-CoA dehydrogenase